MSSCKNLIYTSTQMTCPANATLTYSEQNCKTERVLIVLDGGSTGGGTPNPTNLALGTATATTQPITNSNGTGIVLPSATPTTAGLFSGADKTKLDSIIVPSTNTLTASGSKFTSTVNGIVADLIPATGVIANTLGFDAAGNLVLQVPTPQGVTSVASTTTELTVVTGTTTALLTINSAPKLTTPRLINGVAFDGTADITITDPTKQDKTSVATHTLIPGTTTVSQIIRLNDQTLDSDLDVDSFFSVTPTKDATGKIIVSAINNRNFNIPRTNTTLNVLPSAVEAPLPIDGDTAIVTLSSGVVEYYNYVGGAWIFSSSTTPVVLDGNNTFVQVRTNNTLGVEPTAVEVPTPIDGDTAVITLSDFTEEFWAYQGGAWVLISTKVDPTTANNGLTKTGLNIQLGGPLIQPTIITTDAVNTLALAGLQTGVVTDTHLVVDATGVVKLAPAAVPPFSLLGQVIPPSSFLVVTHNKGDITAIPTVHIQGLPNSPILASFNSGATENIQITDITANAFTARNLNSSTPITLDFYVK